MRKTTSFLWKSAASPLSERLVERAFDTRAVAPVSSTLSGVRILAVHHDAGLSGACLLFESVIEGLAKTHGATVFQTFAREGPLVDRAKALGPVEVDDQRPRGRRHRLVDSLKRLGRGARRERGACDLIFANTVASLAVVERMMAQEPALAALPLVVYVHESRFLLHMYDLQATTRMLRHARLIFAVSSTVRQTLEEVIQPAARIAVVSGFLLERA